jgi:hypothetical protein
MKLETRINRIAERRQRLETAVDFLRVAVTDDYQTQGNPHNHAVSYACGYIQSALVSAMVEVLTPSQIQEVVGRLDQRRETYYAATSIRAREAA